jgi:hypothetical protein
MRYQIIENADVTIIHVLGYGIEFGFNQDPEYNDFRTALEQKGIDAFIDLLIEDSTTAFTKFTELNG